jgi:hypothetical protein
VRVACCEVLSLPVPGASEYNYARPKADQPDSGPMFNSQTSRLRNESASNSRLMFS